MGASESAPSDGSGDLLRRGTYGTATTPPRANSKPEDAFLHCCATEERSNNQVYIGYSVYDAAAVNRLASELEGCGFVVLLDEAGVRNPKQAGRSHRFTDQALVDGAKLFIFCISNDSIKSVLALEAFRYAALTGKTIIPFLLEHPRSLQNVPADVHALISRSSKLFLVERGKMTSVDETAEKLAKHLLMLASPKKGRVR